jgi:hypothetical protein
MKIVIPGGGGHIGHILAQAFTAMAIRSSL